MKEKILQFLKTNAKLAGVQESYLSGVAEHFSKTITEESQIATTISDGVVDLLKLNAGILQTEGDRRATEASKTALKTYQEKHGLDDNGKPKTSPVKENSNPDPSEPTWFKSYREMKDKEIADLKTEFENQKKEKASASLTEKVKAHPKLKDIPATFLEGRNLIPASEAEIDNLVTSIETAYNGFKQDLVDKGVIVSQPPSGGGGSVDKSTIDSYLDEKFPKEESKNK